MLLQGICMQVTLYTEKAKDDTFIKTTTYRIPTFSQNIDKSIEEILTNKNVKE
jgi:hypothetical protein